MPKHSIPMTLLGVGSGVVVTFAFKLQGDGFTVVGFLREASVGLVFGIAFAAYFNAIGRADPVRALGIFLVSAICWMIALKSAIEIYDVLAAWIGGSKTATTEFWTYAGTGLAAGAIGAALLVASLSVVLGLFRGWRLRVSAVICGAVTGALLGPTDALETGLVLFPIWQGTFGYFLARALAEADSVTAETAAA